MPDAAESRWAPNLGAVPSGGGTTFRVWAPEASEVALFLETRDGARSVPLDDTGDGYREITLPGLAPGDRYGYLLDGEGPFPDPCSRRQPEGVHGLSEVVDPAAYQWNDAGWTPPPFRDLVIYECHIGTLTSGGRFETAIGALPALREMGISAVELMPVASFPGRWNWGYDGASLFAPAEVYGGPEGLRRFVDAAHRIGLAVILDVVYNHFGPDGNYTGLYSAEYMTDRYQTPWGQAVNFDGPGSAHTRQFFRENLLHWLHEYHIDGFRFDATHAIIDASPIHILAELAGAVEDAPGRPCRPYLIAESHENDIRYLTPRPEGGFGFDAVWADDFHHSVRTALLHEDEGYFRGFEGSISELARTIRQGFLYEGQPDAGSGAPRGTPARGYTWTSFVYCIQNHDQIGNRPFGQRLNVSTSQGDFMAATLLLLVLPQIPLLFQGQEHLASQPFLFFSDHHGALGQAVTEGRRREFGQFRAFNDPLTRATIPDPQAESSFQRSKLDPDEAMYGLGLLARSLCRSALDLRKEDAVLREYRDRRLPVGTTVRGRCLLLTFRGQAGTRWVALNLGECTAMRLQAEVAPTVIIHSNEGRFGGNGEKPAYEARRLIVPAHSAVVLRQ